MRGLLISFDLRTGIRAGGISPKDPKLPCWDWQDLERSPALEIRLVLDDRDLSYLEGVEGVTILEDEAVINDAIKSFIPTKYAVKDKELLIAHMKEKKILLDTLVGLNLSDNLTAKDLYDKGLAGIIKKEPKLV